MKKKSSLKEELGGGGLNLEQESLHVGIPHQFRLNCPPSLGQGDPELRISCNPLQRTQMSNKSRSITKRSSIASVKSFQGMQVGHELWVKYDGHHHWTKTKISLCRVYQNMTFPTCLSEDREEFLRINEILPYPIDFLHA